MADKCAGKHPLVRHPSIEYLRMEKATQRGGLSQAALAGRSEMDYRKSVRGVIGQSPIRLVVSEQARFFCCKGCLRAVFGVQLSAEGSYVQLDGDLLEVELTGDFLIGETTAETV